MYCAVSLWVKIVCKISGSKIWSCKIFDKYHLCWAQASREIAWHLMCFGKGGNFWHFLSFCRNFRHFSQKFLSFCHFPSFSEKTCLAKKVPGIPDSWIQHILSPDWALEQCSLSTLRKRDLGARRRMVRQDQWSDQVWSLPSQLVGTIPACDVTTSLQLKRMPCLLMRVKKKYGWKSEQLGHLSKQCVLIISNISCCHWFSKNTMPTLDVLCTLWCRNP